MNLPGVSFLIGQGFFAAPAIGYERIISNQKSLGGDITLILGRGFTGIMVRPEFRYYFKKDAVKRNKGWYVGAQIYDRFISYRGFDSGFNYAGYYINVNSIGVNLIGGYQWVWKSNFFFNLGAGWGPPQWYSYQYLDRNSSGTYFSNNWTNIELFIRLGYSF